MRKLLSMVLGCLILISFMGCRSLSDKQEELGRLGDSLVKSRSIIDSLVHSRAILFDKGLHQEKDSVAAAIAIYKRLSQDRMDDFYSIEAKNRLYYLGTRKFLETIRIANADSIDKEKYFNQFPGYSVDTFLSCFSKHNFSIYDADADRKKEARYSIEELRKELAERSGPAFDVIAQMGYFYSLQYATYPDAGFPVYTVLGTDSYVAVVANCRLIFTFNDKDIYTLMRIESYYLTDK